MSGFQRQKAGWRSGQEIYGEQNGIRRRPVVARSAFMRAEEIDREREMSGWNQYEGEEEQYVDRGRTNETGREDSLMARDQNGMQRSMTMTSDMGTQRSMTVAPDMGTQRSMTMAPDMGTQRSMTMQPEQRQPYFRVPDYTQVLEAQKAREKDLRMLQSMYPQAAKMLLPYVEEECDRQEYEGSAMFDEYPGQTTVERMRESIYDQVRDQFPEEPSQAAGMSAELFSMQYQGHPHSRPGQNWLGDLIQVMLLQEMHHRRCRHHTCRPRPF